MRNEYEANRELSKNSTKKENPFNNKSLYDGKLNDSTTWKLI